MADNIMGGGDEIDLGLNVNLGLDRSIQDASTLANQIRDMRQDQEAFAAATLDSNDKLSQGTDELKTQLDIKQQLLDTEMRLKDTSADVVRNAGEALAAYRDLGVVIAEITNNMRQLHISGTLPSLNNASTQQDSVIGRGSWGGGEEGNSAFGNPGGGFLRRPANSGGGRGSDMWGSEQLPDDTRYERTGTGSGDTSGSNININNASINITSGAIAGLATGNGPLANLSEQGLKTFSSFMLSQNAKTPVPPSQRALERMGLASQDEFQALYSRVTDSLRGRTSATTGQLFSGNLALGTGGGGGPTLGTIQSLISGIDSVASNAHLLDQVNDHEDGEKQAGRTLSPDILKVLFGDKDVDSSKYADTPEGRAAFSTALQGLLPTYGVAMGARRRLEARNRLTGGWYGSTITKNLDRIGLNTDTLVNGSRGQGWLGALAKLGGFKPTPEMETDTRKMIEDPQGQFLFPAMGEDGQMQFPETESGQLGLFDAEPRMIPNPNYGKQTVKLDANGNPIMASDMAGMSTSLGKLGLKAYWGLKGAEMLYNTGAQMAQEGQLYTGLTGGTSIGGALSNDLAAQFTSGFGLNPMESYGTAKEIRMQALANFGQNGSTFNDAIMFGNAMASNYGMDPNQSMQLFSSAVVQAGNSVQNLQSSMDSLAKISSSTSSSFQGMIQNFQSAQTSLTQLGVTGPNNSIIAQASSAYSAGNLALQQNGIDPASILNSLVGQSLLSQNLGTNILGLPNAMSNGNAGNVMGAMNETKKQIFQMAGITSANWQDYNTVSSKYTIVQMILQNFGMTQYTSMKSYIEDVQSTFNSTAAKVTAAAAKTAATNTQTSILQGLTGSSSINPGYRGVSETPTSINQILETATSTDNAGDPNGVETQLATLKDNQHWATVGFMNPFTKKWMTLAQMQQLSPAMQQTLSMMIATGQIQIGGANKSMETNGQTLGQAAQASIGNNALQGTTLLDWTTGSRAAQTYLNANMGTTTVSQQQAYLSNISANGPVNINPNYLKNMTQGEANALNQLELGPQASKFFALVQNPAQFATWINGWLKRGGNPPALP